MIFSMLEKIYPRENKCIKYLRVRNVQDTKKEKRRIQDLKIHSIQGGTKKISVINIDRKMNYPFNG